jgi:toxin ParE1/3/4
VGRGPGSRARPAGAPLRRHVVVLPEAEEELALAGEWYEERQPGLGVEFVAEVDEALSGIGDQPEAWPLWRSDRPYRKRTLARFPYVIFYSLVAADLVEIAAIAHGKRRPGYWVERRRS